MSWKMADCKLLLEVFSRRKMFLHEDDVRTHQLKRVMGLLDLLMLGIGSTLGLGAYVLAGKEAHCVAGPAVVLSFTIAAVASMFAGICYAEFAARVPKAGSAYVFAYVTVGELAAFVIGWDLIMEYAIGAASLARALTDYIDNLTNYTIKSEMLKSVPINIPFLADHPDFIAFLTLCIFSAFLAWGVQESSLLNKLMTSLNLITIAVVLVVGSFHLDISNWSRSKEDLPLWFMGDHCGRKTGKYDPGEGGFLPFGLPGVMTAAATCFYGFVGFDGVATSGEDAKRPKRDIPLAIMISLSIILFIYLSLSCVLTLVVPYYNIDPRAPIPGMFESIDMPVLKYIVSAGAISAICTNIIGCLFPMPRVLLAMGRDRLLFPPFAWIHPYTHTPVVAIVFGAVISGTMALIFDTQHLVDMMSIGTLMAYSLVAVCVLKIRFEVPREEVAAEMPAETQTIVSEDDPGARSRWRCVRTVLNTQRTAVPNQTTENVSKWLCAVIVVLSFAVCLLLVALESLLPVPWAVLVVSLFGVLLLFSVVLLWQQPRAIPNVIIKVPLVPLVPCLSLLINFYLMSKLDKGTWLRFIAWSFVGALIYLFYSINHSLEGKRRKSSAELQHLTPAVGGTNTT